MGGIWLGIDADRWAEDRLWHSAFSHDLLQRDWAGFTVPLSAEINGANQTGDGTVNDLFTVELFLPPDWNNDPTFDDLKITVSLFLYMKVNNALDSYDITIEDGTNSATVDSTTSAWFELTTEFTTWVSGQQTLQIQEQSSTGSPSSFVSASGALDATGAGPRSFYQVQQQ